MLRIGLFLLTNVAIMVVISIVFKVLGLEGFLDANGVDLNLQSVLVGSLVVGFMGSFISLAMSKSMAKRSMGVQVIDQPTNSTERWLVDTVHRQAKQANIGMPEVGIFDSHAPNAFATGMNRNAALVAVSTGLLQNMTQDEVEAVLAHEVSHVANGDMVTMTLVQGVVNTFVYFLATVIGHIVDRVVFKNESGHGVAYFVTQIIAQIVLSFLASIIVMWFSRWREFRADAGGARLAGREKMIAALDRLRRVHEPAEMPAEMAAFGINDGFKKAASKLFLTHPPLEERIEALRSAR
ncbi:MAG: protease HtpX [Thiotrichales bacterium]